MRKNHLRPFDKSKSSYAYLLSTIKTQIIQFSPSLVHSITNIPCIGSRN